MIKDKIFTSVAALQLQVEAWKADHEKVVFTNGCFDLIHMGHIHYLEEAKSKGQRLIVALNSDASVSALKGPHRPINDEATRSYIMAAFYFTDAIILFNEDTPYDLISALLPDALVKGGDWKTEQIVGSDVVINNGGSVYSLSFIEGYSTTLIEQKIISAHVANNKNKHE